MFKKKPLQALEHPAFKNMVHIASRATREVKIINRHQTRTQILTLFREQINGLKVRLNVCVFIIIIIEFKPHFI
jgi:hypothetical protein